MAKANEKIVTQTKCSAFGCGAAPGSDGLFCDKDRARLPKELRGPERAKQAVVHLAMKDGYLVAGTRSRTPQHN